MKRSFARFVPVLILLQGGLVFAEETPLAVKEQPLTPVERSIVARTNLEREKQKLPPLTVDPELMRLAQQHSSNMARQQKLSHDLDGKTFSQRFAESGYPAVASAENAAMGQQSTAQLMQDWMKSPGHRTNLLGRAYTHIGVGYARSSSGQFYYTQIFAGKASRR